jgi:hypothetical protein
METNYSRVYLLCIIEWRRVTEMVQTDPVSVHVPTLNRMPNCVASFMQQLKSQIIQQSMDIATADDEMCHVHQSHYRPVSNQRKEPVVSVNYIRFYVRKQRVKVIMKSVREAEINRIISRIVSNYKL